MSIEDRIAELTAAVTALTAALTAKPQEAHCSCAPVEKKVKKAKAEEPPPVAPEVREGPAPEPEVKKDPEAEKETPAVTFEEVRREFLELYKTSPSAAQGVVNHFKVPKLTPDLIAAKGAEVLAEIQKAKAA